MKYLPLLILWFFSLLCVYKWGETNGYQKCANDVPGAFHEALSRAEKLLEGK